MLTAKDREICKKLLAACKVIALDGRISAWLEETDPKALEQIQEAIRCAEGSE